MTIPTPTIIKIGDTKHNNIKRNNTNHSSQSQPNLKSNSNSKSKVFAVSAAALFIVPSSYSIIPLSPVILSSIPMMASLCVYASSLAQIHEIYKTKSTLNYSPIPFISLLNNGLIWGIYGALSSNPTIMLTNAIAISSGLVGIAVFAKNNANSSDTKLIRKHCTYSSAVLLSLASSYNFIGDCGYDMVSILGLIGCGTAVIQYASPLCMMRNVIKNKSASTLSFALSSTLTMNAATWFCYGWFITDDLYVWIPCLLGFGAGLVQLSLFAIY